MFIYFDRNGVLQEVINDKAARLGDLNANEIYVYVDEVELDDIWLTLKRPDGTLSVEKSFIANKVVREIPYDPKRDMKFFKDFKEYEFYKFTISDEITIAGVYQATIRMTYEDTLSALGVLVFKAETGVIKSDQNITQAQYDYLIWYVGSWQGQIGDLEEAMGIAQADILGLKNRMNVAEQDINKIEDGTTIVDKAKKDEYGNRISTHYATQNTLDDALNQIEVTGEIVAKNAENAEYAKKDASGRNIIDTYLSALAFAVYYYGNEIEVETSLLDGDEIERRTVAFNLNAATIAEAGLLSAQDKQRLNNLWAVLQNSEDASFVDTITEMLAIFANYPEGMDIVAMFATKADKTTVNAELALKSDKVETRAIGEETITYTGDKVTQIESDTVLTEIFYKPNGEIDYITEFYKGDSKTYKTTLTKVEGIITKTTKELI